MEKMEILRIVLIYLEFFSGWLFMNLSRKPYGIIKLLLIMLDNAKVETTTIEITAENPPKKTKRAKKELLFWSGNNNVKYSALTLLSKVIFPAHAIKITKMLNNNKYNGNIQMACLRCFSLAFSTTETWNCLGNKKMALKDSIIINNQLKPLSKPLILTRLSKLAVCDILL